MARTNELGLITRAAQMYYMDRKSQVEISRELHVSQATISRLLARANRDNIVRVAISAPRGTFVELESRLHEEFALKEVIVADCSEDREDLIRSSIGDAAAHYVETTIDQGEVIGIPSWSRSLLRMVDSVRPLKRVAAERVVQILGGMGNPAGQFHATHLTTRLAQLTNAAPQLLLAPGVTSSVEAQRVFVNDPYVNATLDQFNRITFAVVGIGGIEPAKLLADSGNLITAEEIEDLLRNGAVGDVALRFFDGNGSTVRTSLDDRVISISLAQLQAAPRVIGVAGGSSKIMAIRGALRGRHVKGLITDKFTAAKLVELGAKD